MTWRVDQISSLGLIADETDDPVVTFAFQTPAGVISIMGEAEEAEDGTVLCLLGMHIEGPGANEVGRANLRVLADFVMEEMGYDAIEVEGAARTTGANPGRRSRRLRFPRRARAARET